MRHRRFIRRLAVSVLALAIVGCGKKDDGSASPSSTEATPPAHSTEAAANPNDQLLKISQFGASLYCSIACDAGGTLHAIYTDRADATKSAYVYYRASADGGGTWSEPKNLSDDDSGLSSYYCKILVDGKGRTYAVWKYLTAASDSLEGPGGACCGIVAYRCLSGGAWSNVVRLCDTHATSCSYFAAVAPNGVVNIVWDQGNKDVDWLALGGVQSQYANQINQTTLDGDAPTTKALITPKLLPTKEQQEASKAAGHYMTYEETSTRPDGLWSLRGYVDAAGLAHFVADHSKRPLPSNPYTSGPNELWHFDGKTATYLADQKDGIQFNNPATLLLDAKGKEHLIRMPLHGDMECVRDYPIEDGKLGDGVNVIAPAKAPGGIEDFQAFSLPGGRMVVTAALSEHGGWNPDDTEMFTSSSDGDGKWTPQLDLTNNAARQAFMSKQTTAGGVIKSDVYRPDFADVCATKDGHLAILMVNTDKAVVGVTQSGVTGAGQTVGAMSSYSSSAPWVFFKKVAP